MPVGKERKRTKEQGVVQNVGVVVEHDVLVQDVYDPPVAVGVVEDDLWVQDVLDVPLIGNLPKLNQ